MTSVRFTIVIGLLSVLLVLSSSCSNSNSSSEPQTFTIAMTGYLMGQVDPCKCPGNPLGGLARRATAMKTEAKPESGLLVVDAGKWVSLDMEQGTQISEAMAAGLSELGVQAMNVTMREARLGKENLLELQDRYDLPLLSANLVDTTSKKPIFPAYDVIKVNFRNGTSMEVAVIGVCRAGSQNYMPPESGLEFLDADELLLKAFNKVKDKPCVILLCDADRAVAANWLGMLEEQTGQRPDMVLSSNMQPIRTQRVLIGQTPMTTAGRQGKYLDLVQAVPLEEGGWDIRKSGVALNAEIADDPQMAELVARLAPEIDSPEYDE